MVLENGSIVTRMSVSSGPSCLILPPNRHTPDLYAYYGASDGSIGLISYEESVLSNTCLVEGRGLGSVVCMGWYSNNGTHLAIGRHDGSIQLYALDLDNPSTKPCLKYTYFCGEPVTSVCGGSIGTEDSEILVATFSGRIFALRSRRLVSGLVMLGNVPPDALASRRIKLEGEISRLEKQVANEREKYQRSTRSIHAGVSAPPLLDIQYELSGATREGWQEARITSAVPLDMLFIYCTRKLDLQTDNAAVLSICPSQGSQNDMLATVRCQAGTRRLWVRIRYPNTAPAVHRSECTRVLLYALPAGAPRVARSMTIRLPVLPYYSQHEDPLLDVDKRCWCQVHVAGSFSVAEMTSWLAEALPCELPRPATSIIFARCHTLLKTILICQYQRGSAAFKSDNVSTIAVIRDVISNCSLKKGIRVEISCDVPVDCCLKSFEKLESRFKIEYQKKKDVALKHAIGALDLDSNMVNDETPIICNEYKRVWESQIEEEVDINYDELVETIEQWYVDWRALTLYGTDQNKERLNLRKALQECELEEIYRVFSNESIK